MARVPLRAQRRRSDHESLWLITFADLMVQLMAFFAIAYSFSSLQSQTLIQSLQKVLGVAKAQPQSALTGDAVVPSERPGSAPERAADLEKLLSDLTPVDGEDLGVRMRIVTFRGAMLFDEGRATLPPAFEPMLARVPALVGRYPGFTLVCEGHAAPDEKGRNGTDALELSSQRALVVMRYLVAKGVDADRLSVEARGASLPDGDASSPEGRALQRRVKFRFQRLAER